MVVEFWPAATLRHDYDVIASFYQVKIGKEMFQYRNHAVIFRKGLAIQQLPDAVIVMANPGSCFPKDPNYQPPILKTDFINASYVEVKDDPTQLQLIRLMKLMHWNALSIINLSDIYSSIKEVDKLSIRRNDKGLIYLDEGTISVIFDCVYGINDNLSLYHNKVTQGEEL
ncbi:hypothetical protein QNK12_15020 [Neobacillus cucumis]|nr:hypothetical protein QNK12_15020 [Neobacillus cucumis]